MTLPERLIQLANVLQAVENKGKIVCDPIILIEDAITELSEYEIPGSDEDLEKILTNIKRRK